MRRKVFSLVFLLFASTISVAQSATTSLRGTVTDPQNAAVVGAQVTLSDPATSITRTGKTDANGQYQFLQIPPGTYNVSAAAPGFGKTTEQAVRLLVNTPSTLNITLKVQTIETVEVSGEVAPINTQDATIGNAVTAARIQALPFEGRDPAGILSLQPGVVYTGRNVDPGFDSRSGSVSGARSDQTNITLDGIDNNNQTLGLAFEGALRATLDSLQEFRVITSNSNADSGRSSGAQVNLVTKSGTNNFHGTLYEYNRPTITTANDWFNKRAQIGAGLPNRPGKLIRNTFGGTVGGPIVKDRVFFFGAYEAQRRAESTQITRIVPSELLRQGIIRYVNDSGGITALQPSDLAAMDPGCSANGTCPLGPGPNPAVLAIWQKYPLPNTDSVGDGLNFRGFTFPGPTPGTLATYIAKFDFNVTRNGNHRVFVRGGLQGDKATAQRDPVVAQTGDGGPEFPGLPANITERNNSRGVVAAYTALLTPALINNFRYGFIRQGTESVGLKTQAFNHWRGLDNPFGFNTSTRGHVPVHNFVDDVTWTKGKHTLQFGGNARVINNLRTSDSTSFFTTSSNVSWLDNASIAGSGSSLDPGAFGFPNVANSFSNNFDSPVAALVGLITEVDANFNINKQGQPLPEGQFVPRHFRAHEAEFYGQDSWRATPDLVLTFGLRYTLLQPPYETTGTQVAPSVSLNEFVKQRAAAMFAGQAFNPAISFDLSGQANGRRPYWAWDYADLAPRFAFAWSPGGNGGILKALFGGARKTSIRGGYGIYFDHFGQALTNTFDRNGSFGLTTTITNPAGTQDVDCAARFSGLFNIPNGNFCGQALGTAPAAETFPVTPPTDLFAITWGLDDKLKTPYSHVFDFSITRELPAGFVFETAYVGRLGRRLLQEEDLAMPLDLVDTRSGVDYFAAATHFAKLANANTPVTAVAPIPYWENLFPLAAGPASANLFGCGFAGESSATTLTATQAMYDLFACNVGNETSALFFADLPQSFGNPAAGGCFPACATINGVTQPNQFFDGQWSSLYAWRTIGNSAYHSAQFMIRHRRTYGLEFDFNYTLSKSTDVGSNAERINEFEGFGLGSQIINTWQPNALHAVSDFDTTHQINSNWVYELPFGRGKQFAGGMNSVADAVLGGWQLAGLFRWTSGFPFTIGPGLGFWGTNWQLTSSGVLTGAAPKTGRFVDKDGDPNVFQNGPNASTAFRIAFPGESGQRNNLRGPGFLNTDMSLTKQWKITESQNLKFSWEVFNLFNNVRFDVATMAATNGSFAANASQFGKFTKTLSTPRLMEFMLRYSF